MTPLARYTHRIALSNAHIQGLEDDQVSLRYRDYREGEHKTLTLEAPVLIRRFLLHVLPKGLMRVRHYGLQGNRCRVQRLAQIRQILAAPPPEPRPEAEQGSDPEPGWPCPVCRRGRMRPVREIPPRRAALGRAPYRSRAAEAGRADSPDRVSPDAAVAPQRPRSARPPLVQPADFWLQSGYTGSGVEARRKRMKTQPATGLPSHAVSEDAKPSRRSGDQYFCR